MKIKSFFVATLMMAVLFSSSSAIASDTSDTVVPEIVAVYTSKEGVLTEISLTEYRQIIEQVKELELQKEQFKKQRLFDREITQNPLSSDGVVTPLALYNQYIYSQSGFINLVPRYNLTRRVTPATQNQTTGTVTQVFAAAITETWGANVSITGSDKINAITAGITIGASWNQSVSGNG
jgi:hypothetical protein